MAGSTFAPLEGQTGVGGDDAFVAAFELDGQHAWTRQFGSTSGDRASALSLRFGTTDDDSITGLAVTSGIVVGGHAYGEFGTDVGPYYGSDPFVIAFSRSELGVAG